MFGASKFRSWLPHPGCNGGKGGSAPDYTPIAQSNAQAAQLSYQAAEDNLNFAKQQYAQMAPRYQQLFDMAQQTAQSQMNISQQQENRSEQQWNTYQNQYMPIAQATVLDSIGGQYLSQPQINQALSDISGTGLTGTAATSDLYNLSQTAQNNAANQAITQANAATNSAAAQQTRALARYGIDPSKFSTALAGLSTNQALAGVQAAQQARQSVMGQGVSLRSGVANYGAGMPNTAAQATGLALQAGNSSTGNMSVGANSGLNAAQYVSNQTGPIVQSQNQLIAGNDALMNNMTNAYGIGSQAAAAGGASAASGIGTAVGVAIAI